VRQLALLFVTERGRRREMLMCATVSFMVCYRVREMEGNGDVCCS